MYFKTDELQQEMLDDVQKKLMNLVNSTEGKVDKYALPFTFMYFMGISFMVKTISICKCVWLSFKKPLFFLYSDELQVVLMRGQ